MKYFLLFFPFFYLITVKAQTKYNKLAFGSAVDFKSFSIPSNIDYFPKIKFQPGVHFSLSKYVSPSFNTGVQLSLAKVQYPYAISESIKTTNLIEPTFLVKYKLNNDYILSENFFVAPYFISGVGVARFSGLGITHAFVPIGSGVQLKLFSNFYANTSIQYNLTMSKTGFNYLNISAGIIYCIGKERVYAKKAITGKTDFDNDGIADVDDKCPSDIGTLATNGCPDADGDGIIDDMDECPTVKGYMNYKGCIDTDGDGISDNYDNCPNEKGTKELQGCLMIDTDGDSLPDDKDKCPNTKGSLFNYGCPLK